MPKPLDQLLNEKLRDAQLAMYLAHAVPQDTLLQGLGLTQTLKTANDLYAYWLMDVLVSQAVPTSRVASAIASLQQYINGISLGLEPGYEIEGMSHAQHTTWQDTLHNYSTWHASQQLRYFPSNFLNPELRIHKTDNFQQLENEINQCRIQSSTVLSAVQSYLGRFEDIANLTTLNGYIDGGIDEMANSMYYFVGKSRIENTYYWRSLDMAKRPLYPSGDATSASKQDMPEASAWSDWQKIPLPFSENIPDRSVRPVCFNNRLFIIWAQVLRPTPSISEHSPFSEADINEDDRHYKARLAPYLKSRYSKISLNFIYKKYDGSWSMPQVCLDEHCVLKTSVENINTATTTIATLDSSTQPPSLFLGLHLQTGKKTEDTLITELDRGFYQAVRLDLQFDIERLYSMGTLQDFFPYQAQREVAKRCGAIFGIHNRLNFNFRAPICQFSEIQQFENDSPHPNSSAWNYDKKQDHIKPLSNKSEMRFNITTSALEVKSTLAKDFPKHQTLIFKANNGPIKFKLQLSVDFDTDDQMYINLYEGSSISLTQTSAAVTAFHTIAITSTATNLTFENFIKSATNGNLSSLPVSLKGDQITLDLSDCKIDQKLFIDLFDSYTSPYAFSLEVVSNPADTTPSYLLFDSSQATALQRVYKHVIIIPLERQTPTPSNIYRANTQILGESDASRRYLQDTLLELKSEQSMTVQVQLDPLTLRPYAEKVAQPLAASEQTDITLLHGVAILEVNIRKSTPHLLGYALKSLKVTLNKKAEHIIPRAPKLTRITSALNSTAECIDFSGSMIERSDAPHRSTARAPIRMNTCFAEKLTKAAGVSLEALFTLPPASWLEPPLIEAGQAQPLDFHGAHGKYYWELFLYLPWMIAHRLNMEQRYAEAQKWLHYLFNPGSKTDVDQEAADFWRLNVLTAPISELSYARDNPYDPNQLALSAPIHFRRALYQLYLDILINRGDAAYRQMTADSLSEAKLWYVRANGLLGPRPLLSSISNWTNITLKELSTTPSTALRRLEAQASQSKPKLPRLSRTPSPDNHSPLTADTPYLRRPLNPSLTARWDTIDSRLHNLRHHLDMAGKPLQVSLFATPLSPHALLIRTLQGGNNGQVGALNAHQRQAGHYRFQAMQAQAMHAVDNLIQLGNTLLSLFERKEQAEQMTLQYAYAWDLSTATVDQQTQVLLVDEKNQRALRAGRKTVEARVTYFTKQMQESINAGEARAGQDYQDSSKLEVGAYAAQAAAGMVMMLPNIFGTSSGGMRLEGGFYAVQATLQGVAHDKRANALHLDRTEQFNRRNQEWGYALEQARLELEQIDAQLDIYAEQSRVSHLQLRHSQTAMEQARATYETLSKRFCDAQLYQWLNSQLSTFYFQAYDMTHSLCLAAQASWHYEQADWSRTFIQNTVWNNQFRGLAAGEALKLNMLQMSTAYLQHNQRALEISKTVALSQLPGKDSTLTLNQEWDALKKQLLDKGVVDFELTQALFDADYPGHYLRRIKSISVSLPSTLGPYEDIRATLTQTYNNIQFSEAQDSIQENLHVREEIALSTGLNDSGLFSLNFDHDERYLPFEYTGVVSRWQLVFPNPKAQATLLESLTDIIVHVRYTARTPGGRA